ncbi:MAG: hypothetical protein J6Y28_06920 [Acholeplasmatales bacterium]|nr:hypothetical protein [Acholeplasmatales bacterium]
MLRDLIIISFMATVLLVQEEALTFIPNFQFTFFLIVTYSVVFGFKRTFFIVLIHVLLDNFFMGTFNLFAICPMLFSYTLMSFTICIFKIKKPIPLAFIAALFSIVYAACFIPFGLYILDVKLEQYILADIPYDLILICTNFLLVLWAYEPVKKVLENLVLDYRMEVDYDIDDDE